jgi:molybdopterin/thiamine biosynthesis adenylyltransferase
MTADQSRAELFLQQELGVTDLAGARACLGEAEVVLAVSPEVAGDHLTQLALLTAANILCRLGPFCPSIAISAPEAARVAPSIPMLQPGAPLAPALCRFMTDVQRPADRPVRQNRIADPAESFALGFSLGGAGVPAARAIYGWYDRWAGGFRDTPAPLVYGGPNPFGALLAGALVATAISRLLLAQIAAHEAAPQPLPPTAALSAYSYTRPNRPSMEPDLPDIVDLRQLEPMLLVGGGAVASGVAFALSSLPHLAGTVEVADDDVIDVSNLERHLISTWTDIGSPKAGRLASLFDSGAWNGLGFIGHESRYEALPHRAWRTVIATVDQAEPRRRLQFDLPRVLLNAGTVGSEFLVSRHDYSTGPCAECLYPERPTVARWPAEILAAQTGLELGEILKLQATGAPLDRAQVQRVTDQGGMVFSPETLERALIEGIGVLTEAACTTAKVRPTLLVATIGFVAALPGILLAAELVKEALARTPSSPGPPLESDRNVFRMDTFGDLSDSLDQARPSRDCRCRDDSMRRAYQQRWGGR